MSSGTAARHLVAMPFQAMGSPCEIRLYGATPRRAQAVADLAVADVMRLEQRYSRYRHDSFLSQINRIAAQGGTIEVDDETAALLDYARTCHEQSDGLFDITSGLLRQAWDFKSGRVPSQEAIADLLARIGFRFVEWQTPRLRFTRPGMEMDFGGIVKEYAVDRVASLCLEHGIRNGMINLGGDIRLIGPHPDGHPWAVGIQHPRRQGQAMESIKLGTGAIASSGDYERCITINGVRYGHIFNPRTGWPVRHLAAVSVVADHCVVAGSASTIAMLKEENGPRWLARLGLPHLWVGVDGSVGGSLARSRHLDDV